MVCRRTRPIMMGSQRHRYVCKQQLGTPADKTFADMLSSSSYKAIFGSQTERIGNPLLTGPTDPVEELASVFGLGVSSLRRWRAGVAARQSLSSLLNKAWCSSSVNTHSSSPGAERIPSMSEVRRLVDWGSSSGCIISPFVQLKHRRQGSSGFMAVCCSPRWSIRSGMFLLSVPMHCTVVAKEDCLSNSCTNAESLTSVDKYFQQLDLLALGELVHPRLPVDRGHLRVNTDPTVVSPYVDFLMSSTDVIGDCCNLPFMASHDLNTELGRTLVAQFHDRVPRVERQLQMCAGDHRFDKMYRRAVSLVLSRRIDGTTLVPFIDFVNHSPTPNAMYTSGCPSGLLVADVLDNLISGASVERLAVPHYHLIALRDIAPGEEITIAYSDMSPVEDEGADMWRAMYGFLPTETAMTMDSINAQLSSVLINRFAQLRTLFPA